MPPTSHLDPQRLYVELRRSHSLLNATLEATADGIYVVDLGGRILSYNTRFSQMWRIPAELLRERDAAAMNHVLEQLKDAGQFVAKVREVYADPEAESFDILEFRDGRVFERYSRPQRLDGIAVGRVWSFHDVTQRARAEAAKSEAIAARDQFLSIAGHELKTPLTSLLLKLQMARMALERAPAIDARTFALVSQSITQTERMAALVNSLFDVSRIQSQTLDLTTEPVDICGLVQELTSRFSADLAHAECLLRIDCPEALVGRWDRLRVEQVLTNLLANAIKFGRGQPIEIRVNRKDTDQVELSVRDHGVGIAPENQARIFDRFERVSDAGPGEGLGLGLFIVQKIVAAHGGTVRVESQPGQGAAFTVALPIAAGRTSACSA